MTAVLATTNNQMEDLMMRLVAAVGVNAGNVDPVVAATLDRLAMG